MTHRYYPNPLGTTFTTEGEWVAIDTAICVAACPDGTGSAVDASTGQVRAARMLSRAARRHARDEAPPSRALSASDSSIPHPLCAGAGAPPLPSAAATTSPSSAPPRPLLARGLEHDVGHVPRRLVLHPDRRARVVRLRGRLRRRAGGGCRPVGRARRAPRRRALRRDGARDGLPLVRAAARVPRTARLGLRDRRVRAARGRRLPAHHRGSMLDRSIERGRAFVRGSRRASPPRDGL